MVSRQVMKLESLQDSDLRTNRQKAPIHDTAFDSSPGADVPDTGSISSSRQNAILRKQQTLGNQSVLRLLGKINKPLVQRNVFSDAYHAATGNDPPPPPSPTVPISRDAIHEKAGAHLTTGF